MPPNIKMKTGILASFHVDNLVFRLKIRK